MKTENKNNTDQEECKYEESKTENLNYDTPYKQSTSPQRCNYIPKENFQINSFTNANTNYNTEKQNQENDSIMFTKGDVASMIASGVGSAGRTLIKGGSPKDALKSGIAAAGSSAAISIGLKKAIDNPDDPFFKK